MVDFSQKKILCISVCVESMKRRAGESVCVCVKAFVLLGVCSRLAEGLGLNF